MPKDHATPVSEADRLARAAFRAHCRDYGGAFGLPPAIDVSPRTVARIARGERDVPPGVARQLAEEIRDTHPDRAAALDAWATECAQRELRHFVIHPDLIAAAAEQGRTIEIEYNAAGTHFCARLCEAANG